MGPSIRHLARYNYLMSIINNYSMIEIKKKLLFLQIFFFLSDIKEKYFNFVNKIMYINQ